MKPGIYRGGSNPVFGLWRLTARGEWLFCVPVKGETWKRASDQSGEDLWLLVAESE